MKSLLSFTLFILSLSIHAQTGELDSLISRVDIISKSSSKDLKQLSNEKSLRTEILNKLDYLMNDKTAEDNGKQDVDVAKKLDSLINIEYKKSLLTENASDELKSRIALYDLVSTKENWLQLEVGSAHIIPDKKILEAEVARQKAEIENIDRQMMKMNTAQTSKAENSVSPSDKLYNENSIISQVIASNIESGKQYQLKISLDNKGFEDRKAFMPTPLINANIQKRYDASSSSIIYNSNENKVVSVCQGEVIYAKRLGGSDYTIIIMHDRNYFTVYTGLSKSFVSYGDQVNFNQKIAEASPLSKGGYRISFEIWDKGQSQNPIHWIKNG